MRLHFWLHVMDACAAIRRWADRAYTFALTRAAAPANAADAVEGKPE